MDTSTGVATLDALYEEIQADPELAHLQGEGLFFVPGDGPIDPDLMIVGEAPGSLENARRSPFVGKSGEILTRMLTINGFDVYSDVFLTNVVKYWPVDSEPNELKKTRTPTDKELQASRKHLLKEIEIVNPKIVALCGRSAIYTIFPEINSNIWEVNGMLLQGKYVPLYHPAGIAYNPANRDKIERGYGTLRTYINDLSK